jgi:hypothetical protein
MGPTQSLQTTHDLRNGMMIAAELTDRLPTGSTTTSVMLNGME